MSIGVIAGCVSAFAFFPYLISILKGKTKPNMITWWIWSFLGVLLFFSYKAGGAKETLFVPFVYMITPLATAIISLKYGTKGWTKFDAYCLTGAVVSTIIWFISGSPTIALVLYLFIDLFGLLPTIKKTFYHPEQEDTLAWLLMVIANCLNMFAIKKIEFSILIYPLYLFISGCIIFTLSLRKKPAVETASPYKPYQGKGK